jgi:general stress protein YciG
MTTNDGSMSTSEAGSMSSGKFEKGSKRTSEAAKQGGQASTQSGSGAAGKTDAARRGGENSHNNS